MNYVAVGARPGKRGVMSVQGNGPRQRWEGAPLGAAIISAAISIISVLFNRTDSYLLPFMLAGVLAAGITVWLSSYRHSGFLSRYLRYVMELSTPSGSGGPTGAHVFGPAVSLPGDTFADVDLIEDGLAGRHPVTRYLRGSKPVVLLLIGAPGAGKTTLLRQTALARRKAGSSHRGACRSCCAWEPWQPTSPKRLSRPWPTSPIPLSAISGAGAGPGGSSADSKRAVALSSSTASMRSRTLTDRELCPPGSRHRHNAIRAMTS